MKKNLCRPNDEMHKVEFNGQTYKNAHLDSTVSHVV